MTTQKSRSSVLLAMVALVAAFLFPSMAVAQAMCANRDDILKVAAERFHEAPVAMAIGTSGEALEILASDGGETWTMLVTAPGMPTCIVTSGTDWITVRAVKPGKGA